MRRLRKLITARRLRRTALGALVATVLGLLVVGGCAFWVDRAAHGHVYSAAAVPAAPVALVLGSEVHPDGTPAAFLSARLGLARRLYDTGKVRAILVSGDNSRPDYDEPDVMRRWLIARGLPAVKVVADYAGFDTYDSCARAHLIFGVDRAIVVTQSYGVDRAVSLCRHLGIDASGVADSTVRDRWFSWWRATAREQGACVKAVFDLTTHRRPVFLGRHETGVEKALRAG